MTGEGALPDEQPLTHRKQAIRARSDRLAPERARWLERNAFFHREDLLYLKFLIPEGARVLELGCGTGHLLAALKPSFGVGVDISGKMIAQAQSAHPHLSFLVGDVEDASLIRKLSGPFDFILIVDTLGALDDCQNLLESLQTFCTAETRIVIAHFSHLWAPALKLAEAIRLRAPQTQQNALSTHDVGGLVALADFEPVKSEIRMLVPVSMFGLGRVINRFVAPFPLIRSLCLRHYTVCRSLRKIDGANSATVVIPARNEKGNIEAAITRLPRFSDDLEVIFVEGHSQDGTWDEIQRVIRAFPDRDIKALPQPGRGKADAVYAGFDVARGQVLMILDADLTMPPEQLPKFWHALKSGKGEFINGSRLVYPMEDEAMRFLNLIANRLFSLLFTWLLSQRLTDTLCGTKAIRRSDYVRLKSGRARQREGFNPADVDLNIVTSTGHLRKGSRNVEAADAVASVTRGSEKRSGRTADLQQLSGRRPMTSDRVEAAGGGQAIGFVPFEIVEIPELLSECIFVERPVADESPGIEVALERCWREAWILEDESTANAAHEAQRNAARLALVDRLELAMSADHAGGALFDVPTLVGGKTVVRIIEH